MALAESAALLREAVDKGDSSLFIALLNQTVPRMFDDPRLSVGDRIELLGAFLALSRRLPGPEAMIEAESWLFAYADVALGGSHPLTVASRGRLVMALLAVGRLPEARDLAADGATTGDGRSPLNAMIATSLMQENAFGEAVRLLETELQNDLRLTGPDNPARAPLVQLLGEALIGAQDYRRAVTVMQPVFEWAREGHYSPETNALIHLTYGRALSGAGQHDAAIATLKTALQSVETQLGPMHRTSLLLGLALANAYAEAGDISTYEKVRLRQAQLALNADLTPQERATTLEKHAESLVLSKRYLEAKTVLSDLIALTDSSAEIDPRLGLRARQKLADVLLRVDPLGDGRRLLTEAAEGFERLLGRDHIQTLRARAAAALAPSLDRALSRDESDRLKQLLSGATNGPTNRETLRSDLAILRRFSAASSAPLPGNATVPSELVALLRQLAEAEDSLSKTFSLGGLQARYSLSRLLLSAGNANAALTEIDTILLRLDGPTDDGLDITRGSLSMLRAMALQALGHIEESLAAYQVGVDESLATRRRLRAMGQDPLGTEADFDSGVGWRFAAAAWTMAEHASPEQATALAERAFRAVQTADFGVAAKALALSETRRLKKDSEISEVFASWESAAKSSSSTHLVARSVDLSTISRLGTAEQRLKQAMPDLFSHLLPNPLSWNDPKGEVGARDYLGQDEALVLVVPAPLAIAPEEDPRGFVFAATREGLSWARIPLTPRQLAASMVALRADIEQQGSARAAVRAPVSLSGNAGAEAPLLFDGSTAHNLYMALFGDPDISARLADKSSWLIAPQGLAMSLPYAALVTTPPAAPARSGQDLRQMRWLGVDKALTLIPGVASLRTRDTNAQGRTIQSQLSYVGFGDPDFAGTTAYRAGSSSPDTLESGGMKRAQGRLPALPGTRQEVLRLADLLGFGTSHVFLSAAASEETFERLAGPVAEQGGIGVLHFATHGLLAGDLPGLDEPALALTPVPEQAPSTAKTNHDGLLTASEIAGLHIPADWVILSACDTSGSADFRASFDGLDGLVRAFLLAGARSMLVSHWQVEDEVAVRLTTSSVRGALAGKSRSDALRQAMVDLMRDTSRDGTTRPLSHPAVWAPFFLIGEGDR